MMDLEDLYHDVILDHGKSPRNLRDIGDADGHAEGFNPLCGDRVTVYVKRGDGAIEDISFTGAGCAICMASASMMTQRLKGVTVDKAHDDFKKFTGMLTCEGDAPDLGKLLALGGVRRYPMRVKCATLAWHTLAAALEHNRDPVTTE